MANINKKQVSIAVLAVVLATAMIASVIATSDSAFAKRHHHGHHHHHNDGKSNTQSINQGNSADQRSTIVTAGANSPVQNSGNQNVNQQNTNNGGNAAAF